MYVSVSLSLCVVSTVFGGTSLDVHRLDQPDAASHGQTRGRGCGGHPSLHCHYLPSGLYLVAYGIAVGGENFCEFRDG